MARYDLLTARGPAVRCSSVLWLSAALSAIAFTVANTVRGETERTSTEVDSLRCYYLATGAIERALVYVQWGEPLLHASPTRHAHAIPHRRRHRGVDPGKSRS